MSFITIEKYKTSLGGTGAINLILETIKTHRSMGDVCSTGSLALMTLTYNNGTYKKHVKKTNFLFIYDSFL